MEHLPSWFMLTRRAAILAAAFAREIIPYYNANGRLRSASASSTSLLTIPSVKHGDGLVAPTQKTFCNRFVICIALKLRSFPCFLVPCFKTRKIFFLLCFFQFHVLFISLWHTDHLFLVPKLSPKNSAERTFCLVVFLFVSNIALRQKFGNAKQSLHKAAWLGFATQNFYSLKKIPYLK